jgi:hypothetical protein
MVDLDGNEGGDQLANLGNLMNSSARRRRFELGA